MKTPTPKQFQKLKTLCGHIVLTPNYRDWQPLVNHGWVEAAWGDEMEVRQSGRIRFWPPLRMSPDGYRALADAIEEYGWPEAGSEDDVRRHAQRREDQALARAIVNERRS